MLDALQKDALYAYIKRLASGVASYVIAANEFEADCCDITSVVHAALADVKRNWNDISSAITRVLPTEVLVECYQWLETSDRVRVACVSSSWRSAALGTSRLWSNVDMLVGSLADVSMAKLLISRAIAHPLTISIANQYITGEDDILETLYNARGRIRALTIDNYEPLSLVRFQCPTGVPLRALDIWLFSIADVSQPFIHLASLSGRVRDIDLRDLFRICPNLVYLKLEGSCDLSLLPIGPLPSSLTRLFLNLAKDVSMYVKQWIHPTPRILEFGGMHPNFDLAISLADFIIESLEVHRDHVSIKSSFSEDRTINSFSYVPILLSDPYYRDLLRPKTGRLRRLTLFDDIARLLKASLDLPSLEELTLKHPSVAPPPWEPIFVPELRRLTLLLADRLVTPSLNLSFIQLLPSFFRPTKQSVELRVFDQILPDATQPADDAVPVMDIIGLQNENIVNAIVEFRQNSC